MFPKISSDGIDIQNCPLDLYIALYQSDKPNILEEQTLRCHH